MKLLTPVIFGISMLASSVLAAENVQLYMLYTVANQRLPAGHSGTVRVPDGAANRVLSDINSWSGGAFKAYRLSTGVVRVTSYYPAIDSQTAMNDLRTAENLIWQHVGSA